MTEVLIFDRDAEHIGELRSRFEANHVKSQFPKHPFLDQGEVICKGSFSEVEYRNPCVVVLVNEMRMSDKVRYTILPNCYITLTDAALIINAHSVATDVQKLGGYDAVALVVESPHRFPTKRIPLLLNS